MEKSGPKVRISRTNCANSELLSFFQTMLEKGYFLDSKGLKISVKNALIIFTMNHIEDNEFRFNFTPNYASSFGVEKLEKKLGYKFVSLIDEILFFDNINQNMFKRIVTKELSRHNYLYEVSEIPEIEDNILLYNGGDAAIKKAKENNAWKVFDEDGKVVYEYKKTSSFVSSPATKPVADTTINSNVNVTYAVQVDGGKILPAVKNLADYAGIENKKITGIAMKVDKGAIKYQVHVLGGGWLPWVTGYNWKDHNNGYAGNGKPIDAIRVYYSTPSDIVKKSGYKEAKYRVSVIGNKNYYGWQVDDSKKNGMDGYAGAFGKAIDKFQVHID